ncbi:hypothetical protein H6796_01185 [Candidatus Nomurabacteria bacterium]|nr:hypothetical protein [Candidatus Nomurabacteria bacterium]
MSNSSGSRGFTIVELMLAMAFVSMLLLAIATLTIHVGNLYSRGITMKDLNQSGSELITDLKRTLGAAKLSELKTKSLDGSGGSKVICTGSYSYLINTVKSIEAAESAGSGNATSNALVYDEVIPRVGKLRDQGGVLCPTGGHGILTYNNILSQYKDAHTGIKMTEVLGGGDRGLAPMSFEVNTSGVMNLEGDPDVSLLTVNFRIGTGRSSEIDDSTGRCKPPSDNQSGGEYCAVNDFKVIIRTGNG